MKPMTCENALPRHHQIARRTLLVAAAGLASACANVAKVSTGENLVGDRVMLKLDAAWNQVNAGQRKSVLWTQDGIPLDALEFWVGIKDGDALAEVTRDKRPLNFKAGMAPHELVALFEGLYGHDGSTFKLLKLAPADFLGGKGIRFEYEVLRKADDVATLGVAWALVQGNELFAMTFTAPRLGFFARHLPKVEQAAASARLKGMA
jgi:hypothetical protein